MPYLLDGNNLVGRARGVARPDEEDRAALVREVAGRLRRTKARVVLFFDGGGGPLSLGNLYVRSARGRSADDEILREIARTKQPKEVTVVTADRGLASRARDAGARAILPEDFWSRFGMADAPRSTGAAEPPVDLEDWSRWFADENNREG